MASSWSLQLPKLVIVQIVLIAIAAGTASATAGGPLHVIPHFEFLRSVGMRCLELEVLVGLESEWTFEDHIASISAEPPLSGLSLVATAMRNNSNGMDFEIKGAAGPWTRQLGHTPRLQRLRLQRSSETKDRIFRCKGLQLEDGQPTVDLSLDTAEAYNWLRFTGYLDWTSYMVSVVRDRLPSMSESPPLLVDLGGGSGWLSTLLKANLGGACRILCTDIASEALEIAAADARMNSLEIDLAEGDLFQPLESIQDTASFIYFNPPQIAPEAQLAEAWKGSPDVALLTPDDDETYFHRRFCDEAAQHLTADGTLWLGVNWELLPEVVRQCCNAGWSVSLPEAIQHLTTVPSALLELHHIGETTSEECEEIAMTSIKDATEFQARAIGASNDAEAVERYELAASRGYASAQANLGISYVMGRHPDAGFREEYRSTGLRWLQLAAEGENFDAQVQLARSLAERNEDDDAAVAAWWLLRGAQHGHPQAQAGLGFMHMRGQGVVQDAGKAMYWLEKAAAQGNARALAALADGYASGAGVTQDTEKAKDLYRLAAATGDVVAMTNLGMLLMDENTEEALSWFRNAAEAGGTTAALNLGSLLEDMDDSEEAAKWYAKAAAEGSGEAAGRLAVQYFQGEGLPEDIDMGSFWLLQAVRAEDPEALEMLRRLEEAAEADNDKEAIQIVSFVWDPDGDVPEVEDALEVLDAHLAQRRVARKSAQAQSSRGRPMSIFVKGIRSPVARTLFARVR